MKRLRLLLLALALVGASAPAFAQCVSTGVNTVPTVGQNCLTESTIDTYAATSIALVLIALAGHRLWWPMPPLAIGLILSGSRGGFLILTAALLARYTHWLAGLAALCLGSLTLAFTLDLADSQRLQIWGVTLPALSFFGEGPGTFTDIHFIATVKGEAKLFRPEFAHNDILQLTFEYGIGALLLLAPFAFALSRPAHREWPVLFAFAILTTFYFPFFCPIPAFVGCACAGHIARDWAVDGGILHRWRLALLSRYPIVGSITG